MSGVSGSAAEPLRLELYVRSLTPAGPPRHLGATVDRLARLRERDTIGEYEVIVTGRELPATPAAAVTEFGRFLLHRVAVFRQWASATGRRIDPAIERRTVDSQITGEHHDALRIPTAILAEYEGDDLRFVAPCLEGDSQVSIQDRLDLLASGEVTPTDDRLRGARPTRPPEPGRTG